MKLHCHRPSLVNAFQVVGMAVPARTPKEILKNVKLQVEGGAATLIATDSDLGIRYSIPGVECESSGETLLPAARVGTILRELTGDRVDLELDGDAVTIRSGQSEFRLPVEDPAEFPPVGTFDEDRYYVVAGGALKQMIQRTIFSTDVESTRFALGGILLEPGVDQLTLAATDSRRLAVVRAACRAQGISEPPSSSTVVPSKAMQLIERASPDGDEEVLISLRANDAVFKCGQCTVVSRLVEGRFPKYRDVIPSKCPISIDLVVGPFYSGVRQAQIVTSEESRGVDFAFSQGKITLNSRAADVGQSRVEVPIPYDGNDLTITFDPRYIAEFLRVLPQEKNIRLELMDGESAAVFKTDDEYTYVIMPLSRDR